MNEIFDKLILRIIFSVAVCLLLILYKYAHTFLYPSSRTQLFKKFYPSRNSADTLHFFGRLIGIGIVYSALYFDLSDGILYSILGFLIKAVVGFVMYLFSLYIVESITLYNFEYIDEVIKRKNLCYGVITFSQSISVALILNVVMSLSNNSLILLLFLWLLSIVIYGFATKFYKAISRLSFNKLMIHKNLSLAFSFSGYLFGLSVIIITALRQAIINTESYAVEVLLKIILSTIIFPIFQHGLVYIFKLQDDIDLHSGLQGIQEEKSDLLGPSLGYGIYEGAILFTSAFLTSIIVGHIMFGNFYPLF